MKQTWIKSEDIYINSISSLHGQEKHFIIFPEIFFSKDDYHYFFSRLQKEMANNGMSTILVDNYGCGDSFGDLKYSSIEIIFKGMEQVVKYVKSNYKGQTILISRGLSCNLISRLQYLVDYIYCIDPLISIEEIFIRTDWKSILKFEKYQLTLNELIKEIRERKSKSLIQSVYNKNICILTDDTNKKRVLDESKVNYQILDYDIYEDPNSIYYIVNDIAINEVTRN